MRLQKSMGSPPRVFLQLFRWYCDPKVQHYIEGDLMEVYHRKLRTAGKQKADLRFVVDVLLLFRPGIIRPFKGNRNITNYSMLENYFKISWRTLVKQKTYSMINIGGFAIGVAACILIGLFIKDELSYDTHYVNHKQLYRVIGAVTENGELKKGISFPAPMADVLKRDFPEVKESGRFNNSELFGAGNNQIRPADIIDDNHEEGFVYIDQSLLNMLELEFIYGNPSQALSQPNTIVITKRKAEKYFANENPVGKTMIVNDNKERPYTIGGVVDNFKSTSHINFDFLIGMTGLEFWKGEQSEWGASNYHTYIMVDEGTDVKSLEAKMTQGLLNNYFVPTMIKGGMPRSEVDKFIKEKNAHVELQPLDQIHLYTDFNDSLVHGDIRMVWLFGGIAVFILLIAVINFVNLSTAKSANRAKEVGIRKVVGSFRTNIIGQFLTESIMYSLIAVMIGTAIALALIPYFNSISGKSVSVPWATWWFAPALLASAVLVGIVAGMYPSFYLSSFKPVRVLKGSLTRGTKGSFLRSALVVFQFTTSVILLIGTIVIHRQMNFILNKKIGFDKDQVILIQGTNTLREQVVSFANELRELPAVMEVTTGDYLPVTGSKRNGNSFWNEGRVNIDPEVPSQFWRVDETYMATLGIKLVEGRNFNRKMASDSSAIIINQQMAKELGQDMIGKRITNYAGTWTVIGIAENFHFESLREEIQPLALVLGQEASILAIKLKGDEMRGNIQAITNLWRKFAPHQPIRYSFLDERYAAMYVDVQRTGKIFTSFSVLAILVACLGLFALSAFMVEQRSKEISVRLVLGASVDRIFKMLTWNFVKLVLIAFLLASPLSLLLMHKWLEDYAYKTEIGWDIFAMTGATAILIALFTITYQSLRAAWVNPIINLKNE
jgi:putative ABC transport system permease protein